MLIKINFKNKILYFINHFNTIYIIGGLMDYNKIIIALVIILIAVAVAGFVMLSHRK